MYNYKKVKLRVSDIESLIDQCEMSILCREGKAKKESQRVLKQLKKSIAFKET